MNAFRQLLLFCYNSTDLFRIEYEGINLLQGTTKIITVDKNFASKAEGNLN